MTDIKTVLEEAMSGEPPIGFAPAEVLERGRRARRRRRGGALGALVTGAGVAAAVVALTAGFGGPAGHGPGVAGGHLTRAKLSLAALETAAAKANTRPAAVTGLTPGTARITVDGIAAGRLAGLFQRDTGVRLAQANVSVLPAGGKGGARHPFIDLGAGVAVTGHPYVNVQVTPADTMITATPTCAELSDLSSGNGDGYYGPCRIQRLADGSLLIVRSGRTRSGGFTMAQATLVRPDGSGFFAEDTNQAWISPAHWLKARTGKHARVKDRLPTKKVLPRVVRAQPPVSASVLAQLVRSLAGLSQG
jgi:hypothetical protein